MALLLRMGGVPARVAVGFSPGQLRPQHRRVRRARPRRALVGRGLLPALRLGHVRPDAERGAGARADRRPAGRRCARPRGAQPGRRPSERPGLRRRGAARRPAAARRWRPCSSPSRCCWRSPRARCCVVRAGAARAGRAATTRSSPSSSARCGAPAATCRPDVTLARSSSGSARPRRRAATCARCRPARYGGRRPAADGRPAPRAAPRARPRASGRLGRAARVVGAAAAPAPLSACAVADWAASARAVTLKSMAADSAYDLFRSGTDLLERGDCHAAAVPLARARDLEPGQGLGARGARPGALRRRSATREAAAEFDAVVERAPTNDYALFCLGRSLQLLGRHAEARHPLALASCLRPERARLPALPRPGRAGAAAPSSGVLSTQRRCARRRAQRRRARRAGGRPRRRATAAAGRDLALRPAPLRRAVWRQPRRARSGGSGATARARRRGPAASTSACARSSPPRSARPMSSGHPPASARSPHSPAATRAPGGAGARQARFHRGGERPCPVAGTRCYRLTTAFEAG